MIRRISIALGIFSALIFSPGAACAEELSLEKIVVRPRESPASRSLKESYSTETVQSEKIKQGVHDSLSDLLDSTSGVEVRTRGAFGIQGDLSLRGSTYEQVAVLIDGIRMNDPQTGHHNLDIPLTIFDLEKVGFIKEPVSSLYGAGASAGSINMITRKSGEKRSVDLEASGGEHALFTEGASLSIPYKDTYARVSFEHKQAKAARPNTDFASGTFSGYLAQKWERAVSDISLGYQKKDFGADSFYSNLFPEEEEHTETVFVRAGLDNDLGGAQMKNNLFLRRHRDKFILRRNNPGAANNHTTYVYGLNSALALSGEYGDLLLGLDTGNEKIDSTNLGKHSRLFEAGSFGFTPRLGNNLNADLRLRVDHYQHWGWEESYNLGLGYDILPDKLKIKGSFASGFRIPTFTDLYYSDSANKGSPDLGIERSRQFSTGLEFKKDILTLGAGGFLRRGSDLIDWTRASSNDIWQATNLGRVDFRGLDFSLKISPARDRTGLGIKQLAFSYNYISAKKKASGFLSKYALDILKHKYLLAIYQNIFGLNLSWNMSYNERYYGEKYFLGNLYVGKKIAGKGFTAEPFISIDNLANSKYSEVGGVLQPGRWIRGGIKCSW